jgi:hypothetical protein
LLGPLAMRWLTFLTMVWLAPVLAYAQQNCMSGACGICCENDGDVVCNFESSNVRCREKTGPCDEDGYCSGDSIACEFAFLPPTTVCSPAQPSTCMAEAYCTGASAACPAPPPASATTVCRPAAGPCDVAEKCNGSVAACPANGFSTAVCANATPGTCEKNAVCTGTGPTCPAKPPADVDTVCRAASGTCDVAEKCNGTALTCPANQFRPNGTACDDGSSCTATDTCSAGACVGSGGPLSVSPNPLIIDPTAIGSARTGPPITITLAGPTATSILGLEDPLPSVLLYDGAPPWPLALSPGSPNASFSLVFAPTDVGTFTADLVIESDLAGCGAVPLTVRSVGQNVAWSHLPTSLSFGEVEVPGPSAVQTVTIRNDGEVDLVLTSATIVDGDQFAVEVTLPATVAPGGELGIDVKAVPRTAGEHSARLVLGGASPALGELSVALAAVGRCPAAGCTPVEPPDGGGPLGGDGGPDKITSRRISPLACDVAPGRAGDGALLVVSLLLGLGCLWRVRRG